MRMVILTLCLSLIGTTWPASACNLCFENRISSESQFAFKTEALTAVYVSGRFHAMDLTEQQLIASNSRWAATIRLHFEAMRLMTQTVQNLFGAVPLLETHQGTPLRRLMANANDPDQNKQKKGTRKVKNDKLLSREPLRDMLDELESIMHELPAELMSWTLVHMTREWLEQSEPTENDNSKILDSYIIDMLGFVALWRVDVHSINELFRPHDFSADTLSRTQAHKVHTLREASKKILDYLNLYAHPVSGRFPGDRSALSLSSCRTIFQFRSYWTNILISRCSSFVAVNNDQSNLRIPCYMEQYAERLILFASIAQMLVGPQADGVS